MRGRAPRIQIVPAACRRCGREIATVSRSPLGLDRLKAKWGIICEKCIAPAERWEILQEQAEALTRASSPASQRFPRKCLAGPGATAPGQGE